MTPEYRAALARTLDLCDEVGQGEIRLKVPKVRALLSALEEAEATVARLCTRIAEERAEVDRKREASIARAEKAESESAALRAEVERWKATATTIQANLLDHHEKEKRAEWLRGHTEGMEDAEKAIAAVVSERDDARAEVERMRGALLGLVAWCEQGAWEGEDGGTTRLNAARAALSGGEGMPADDPRVQGEGTNDAR